MSTKKTNLLRSYQVFFVVLGIFCAGAIAVNLVVRRVPVHDATIESDLGSIAVAIDSYVSTQGGLPPSLSQLSELPNTTQKRLSNYEYIPVGPTQYQLCATFLAPGQSGNASKPYAGNGYADPSRHGKGRECFMYRVAVNLHGGPTIQAR